MIISSATGGLRAVQSQPFARRPPEIFAEPVHASYIALAEMAVDLAMRGGATYADIRLGQTEAEYLAGRENHIENCSWDLSLGFGLRVLLRGSWGFAASEKLTEAEIRRAAALALEKAEANARLQNRPIVLEDIPARQQTWVMPVKRDPFAVPLNEKTGLLLEINAASRRAQATAGRTSISPARTDCSSTAGAAGSSRAASGPGPIFP
jgi:TldD protein